MFCRRLWKMIVCARNCMMLFFLISNGRVNTLWVSTNWVRLDHQHRRVEALHLGHLMQILCGFHIDIALHRCVFVLNRASQSSCIAQRDCREMLIYFPVSDVHVCICLADSMKQNSSSSMRKSISVGIVFEFVVKKVHVPTTTVLGVCTVSAWLSGTLLSSSYYNKLGFFISVLTS